MAEDWKDDLQQSASDDPKKEPEIGSSEFANSLRRLRVFLCHSSGDKLSVRDLYWRLKEANVDPWLDEENLLGGQTWEQEIRKAVRNSDIVVVCLSRAAIDKTGYVQKEIKFALDVADEQPEGAIFLIPLKLEECDIPERLRHLHWVSYFQENGFEKLLATLKHKAETLSVQVVPIRKVVEPLMVSSPTTFTVKSVKPTKLAAIKTEVFSLLRTFKGEDVDNIEVYSVAFSPDGQTLASGGCDHDVKLWKVKTGRLLRTFEGHEHHVSSVAISPNGQTLASGCYDWTIKLWNLNTGQLLHTLDYANPVNSVDISPDGQTLVSGGADGNIMLWNLNTGQLLQTLEEHRGSVESVAISPDGQTLASGDSDENGRGTIMIWNLNTRQLLYFLEDDHFLVDSLAISPDGQTLASGSLDDTIKLWNLNTGHLLHILKGHSSGVHSVVFSPDGQTLASGSADGTIKLWNLKTRQLLQTLEGHEGYFKDVYSVAISPDGQTLASGGCDKTIMIWGKK